MWKTGRGVTSLLRYQNKTQVEKIVNFPFKILAAQLKEKTSHACVWCDRI